METENKTNRLRRGEIDGDEGAKEGRLSIINTKKRPSSRI